MGLVAPTDRNAATVDLRSEDQGAASGAPPGRGDGSCAKRDLSARSLRALAHGLLAAQAPASAGAATGWRPTEIEFLLSVQPFVGTADAENLIFLGRGATHTGAPVDVNEAERIGWIPLDDASELTP